MRKPQLIFKGWAWKHGGPVREAAGIKPAEHEGNVMRKLLDLGKKQKLTPQYDRAN